jgi:hypothetical protein
LTFAASVSIRPVAYRPAPSNALWLVTLVVAAGTLAILRGQDANWDLQNYHYYNAWAWWNGRIFDRDIAAAQLQTFHNPLLDMPFFAMVQGDWPPRLIAFVLAIPTGVAAFFYAKLLPYLFFDVDARERKLAIACAFAIGVTGAMGIATLGTTMNEWPLVALVMAALWLIVRALARSGGTTIPTRTLLLAGLLVGAAAGAKLTAATFAVALCVALLVRFPLDRSTLRERVRQAWWFGIGVVAGVAVTFGPWAMELWRHFDSPLFPYFNNWLKSPWWWQVPVLGRVYGPHNLVEWLLFPFNLLGPGERFVTEVPYRDGRFPTAWALALAGLVAWISYRASKRPMPVIPARVSASWRITATFMVVAFIVWTAQHSILRYIVVLEMLTGAVIVSMLQRLLRPGYAAGVALAIAIALIATTRFGDWWHIDFGKRWFDVDVPRLEPDAMVLITGGMPVGYVLPLLPADATHVGVSNNINVPGRGNRLARSIADAIAAHRGPFYELTYGPEARTAQLQETFGLVRTPGGCMPVASAMKTYALEICRLQTLPASK